MEGRPSLVLMGRKKPLSVESLGMRCDRRGNPFPIGECIVLGTWTALARFTGVGYAREDGLAEPTVMSFDGVGMITATSNSVLAIFRAMRAAQPAVWLTASSGQLSVALQTGRRHTMVEVSGQEWTAVLRGITGLRWKPGTEPGKRIERMSADAWESLAQVLQQPSA
jgi:hypothetical protein